MPSLSKTIIPAVALMALVQFCPAPFLAAIPAAVAAGIGTVSGVIGAVGGIAGAVEGGISAAHGRKHRRGAGIEMRQVQNQLAWSECKSQLKSAHVTFSSPSSGDVLAVGVPPACMTLLTVITGKYDEGNPVPQGNNAVLFQNLSQGSIQQIQSALSARA